MAFPPNNGQNVALYLLPDEAKHEIYDAASAYRRALVKHGLPPDTVVNDTSSMARQLWVNGIDYAKQNIREKLGL